MVAADMQSSSSRSPGPQLKLPEPLQDPHDLFHEGGQALPQGPSSVAHTLRSGAVSSGPYTSTCRRGFLGFGPPGACLSARRA